MSANADMLVALGLVGVTATVLSLAVEDLERKCREQLARDATATDEDEFYTMLNMTDSLKDKKHKLADMLKHFEAMAQKGKLVKERWEEAKPHIENAKRELEAAAFIMSNFGQINTEDNGTEDTVTEDKGAT